MSASLRPTEIHKRQHRKEKRDKLIAKLKRAPAGERAAIEAKLEKTYPLGQQRTKATPAPAPANPVTSE